MELKEIQNLIRFVAKSGASEVKLEMKDIKLTIKTGSGKSETTIIQNPTSAQMPLNVQPLSQEPISPVEDAKEEVDQKESEKSKYLEIKSPIIGTFYRKSAPENPAFVSVGDTINAGDTVCIIEAMKLFNEVESEISGKIVKILVEDSSPVEFDQPLFLIDPS